MGGKKPATAEEVKPIAPPAPTPDSNATADKSAGAASSFGAAQQEDEAKKQEEQQATGIGQSRNPRARRDPASAINAGAPGGGLASSAVITG